jgi:hypothetical protein
VKKRRRHVAREPRERYVGKYGDLEVWIYEFIPRDEVWIEQRHPSG